MKKVGITGGIGSGKTTVCKIFESMDIPVYYADAEAKKILASNVSVKKQMKDLLGNAAYHKNGKPDRKFIASKIFSNKELLEKVNSIVHPAVRLDAERWIEKTNKSGEHPYTLQEAALLVENGSYKHMDALIVVTCPEDIRVSRVMKRDRLSYEEVKVKINNQLPEQDKIKVADFVIHNDGKKSLIVQVCNVHKKLNRSAQVN